MLETATPSHSAPTPISPGTTIGRYRLLERIGAGGMGEVWKAHDENLDRDVAIKFLHSEMGDYDGRDQRFRREALALSRLSHPGVATVFDFDIHKDQQYLVMEYVGGGSLESRISDGPLPIDKVLSIGAALADAIDHAHKNGILHRDLKPGNVVFTATGQPKILDFGLALLLADENSVGRVTQLGMIMGSLSYMAPEQLFGTADPRTDTYALGAMLYEMTTGQRPFVRDRTEALMFAIINTAPSRVVWHRPDAPEALDRIISECLRKEPSERPASAAVVAQTLRGIGQGVPTSALPLQSRNARKALALDPMLPDAHVSMGTVLSHSGDVAGGLRHLRRAVELNPGLAQAQNLLGRALYSYERHEEALAAIAKSVTIDPQSMMIYVGVGDAYFFARDYEKSVVHYRLAIGLDPRFDGAHTGLGRSLEALGRFDEARAAYEKGIEMASGVAGPSFGLAHLEIATGNIGEARRRLAELIEARSTRVVSAWGIATLYASLGDIDDAFHWLELGIEERAPAMILLRVHPWLDPIRKDPRYFELIHRLGLDVTP